MSAIVGRSAETYASALAALLPVGAAWTRDPGTIMSQLLRALAQEPARVEASLAQLLEESDPRTAELLLDGWARVTGEPDPCEGPTLTAAARRARVVRVLAARGGQSPNYFIRLAAAMGVAVTIRESRCSRAGEARAGDECAGPEAQYVWYIDAPFTTTHEAIAGEARAGEPLWWRGYGAMECVIGRYQPAHGMLHFTYGRDLDWGWVVNPVEFAGDDGDVTGEMVESIDDGEIQ